MAYDEKCYELAAAFLADAAAEGKIVTEHEREELAQTIQDTIELYIEEL